MEVQAAATVLISHMHAISARLQAVTLVDGPQ